MRRGRGLRLRRALPALVLWSAAACEVLVDGRLGPVHCQEEGRVGPPACPAGLECRLGACVPSALGVLCASDADCAPLGGGDFCLDPQTLGGVGPRRCSRTCCGSSDCDPDPQSLCWIPPHGPSSFCRSAAEIGRAPGGTLGALAACAADGECRSGRCSGGVCTDTCCSDTSCAVRGGVCRVDGPPRLDAPGFGCGPPPGSAARYAPCQSDSDCASGLCLDFGNKRPMCSSSCCASSECEAYQGAPLHCVMLTGKHAGLRACGPMPLVHNATGSRAVGMACSDPSDCRGGLCIDSRCSDICCDDTDCGDAPSQFVCRPGVVDGAWALRCEPK